VIDELDRGAVERIIKRVGDLDADAVVAAGVEVGFDEIELRKAVALERLERTASRQHEPVRLERVVGTRTVVEERIVSRDRRAVVDTIDAWLTGVHQLRRTRIEERAIGSAELPGIGVGDGTGASDADVIVSTRWTRRTDVAASVQRSLRGLTGDGKLGEVPTVTVAAVAVADGATAVRVELDRSARYHVARGTVAITAAATVVLGVAGAVATAPFGLLALPTAAIGTAAAASSRGHARRLHHEAERLITDVEQGVEPTGMIGGITKRLTDKLPRSAR
jgi:hypothetical protein